MPLAQSPDGGTLSDFFLFSRLTPPRSPPTIFLMLPPKNNATDLSPETFSSAWPPVCPQYAGRAATRSEYRELPRDGFRYDMLGGVLQLAPSHDAQHGSLQARFIAELGAYLKTCPLGLAMVEVDVLLPDGGDVLRPDVSFVLSEHREMLARFIEGPPDLVCEVLSESSRGRDLNEKARRYLQCGVREYWIVDPRMRTLEVWLRRGPENFAYIPADRPPVWRKRSGETVASELLPGFRVATADFFP